MTNDDFGRASKTALERVKRASLRHQTLCAAWQLDALVRRFEHEAPELRCGLHDAIDQLLRLGE